MTKMELSPYDLIETKRYKILLFIRYLDTGIAKLSYLKYVIGYVALASLDIGFAAILGVIYGIISFLVGYYWYRSNTIFIEAELGNQWNLFQKELRDSIKK